MGKYTRVALGQKTLGNILTYPFRKLSTAYSKSTSIIYVCVYIYIYIYIYIYCPAFPKWIENENMSRRNTQLDQLREPGAHHLPAQVDHGFPPTI
jgi:hypothetical protein